MEPTKDIDDLIKEGYQQVSRKYRMLARLPENETGMQALARVAPHAYENKLSQIEFGAKEEYLRCYAEQDGNTITLSVEEFAEYLSKTGRTHLSGRLKVSNVRSVKHMGISMEKIVHWHKEYLEENYVTTTKQH